jgi:hypothetical protein
MTDMVDASRASSQTGGMRTDSVPAQVPRPRPLFPDHARRLRAAQLRRDKGRARADERFAIELRALIDLGAEVKATAAALGVSRQTVYEWLKLAPGTEPTDTHGLENEHQRDES